MLSRFKSRRSCLVFGEFHALRSLATAKVVKVYYGLDQTVRSVKLKRVFGEKVHSVVKLSKVLAD